jgi:hypothetical protein
VRRRLRIPVLVLASVLVVVGSADVAYSCGSPWFRFRFDMDGALRRRVRENQARRTKVQRTVQDLDLGFVLVGIC